MSFLNAFVGVFLDMSLYMIIGMVLTGVLHVLMRKETVARHLGPGSRLPAVKAAALGVPLPLCSCGVLPTTVYLGQNGASTSAVMAFLISTPQTGVDSIIATFGMMGVVFAVYRPIAAFISGVAGGALIQRIANGKRLKEQEPESADDPDENEAVAIDCAGSCAVEPASPKGIAAKLRAMANYAFVEFIDDIALHFVVGAVVAALITMLIPSGFFEQLNISSGILAMLVMLVVGLPMYICSTSSIPIAIALMAKGISPGAAFVFLFAGPATNAASLSVLSKSLGKKTVAVYLAVTAIAAIGFGLLLDAIIGWFGIQMPIFTAGNASHDVSWLKIVTGVIFAAVLLRSIGAKLIRRIQTMREKKGGNSMIIQIEGMSCEHCAKTVREALEKVPGVRSVSVDVKEGKAYVHGDGLNVDALKKAVKDAGYDPL